MSDVVTPILGLELPDVGSDDNVWGDILNSNLQAIDQKVLPLTGGTVTGTLQVHNADLHVTGTGYNIYALGGAVYAERLFATTLTRGGFVGSWLQGQNYATGFYTDDAGVMHLSTGVSSVGAALPAQDFATVAVNGTTTFQKPVLLPGDPTAPLGAATKQYVDAKVAAGGADLSHALLDDLAGDAGPGGGSGVGEAPTDGALYGRRNAAWSLVSNSSANILDYGGGIGGDDALAMRNAIASGKKLIVVPPGTYTCKSTIPAWGAASDPVCFALNNKQDTWIVAYGATFLVDNSISGPTPVCMVEIVNNSKHCGVLGATFVGNNTGLSPTAENVGVNFASATGCTVRDVKITGNTKAAFAGVWVFDCLIDNCQAFNIALGLDIAHVENLTVRDCRFVADPAHPVAGINQHYDTPTLGDNAVTRETGTARTLTWGQANRLNVLDSSFEGFNNSIAVEGLRGLNARGCTLRGTLLASGSGTAGVLPYLSAAAQSASLVTQDILVDACDISGHGVTASPTSGGGVLIGPNISRVAVVNCRIYDNTGYGIAVSTLTGTSSISEAFNSYASRSGSAMQIAALAPALLPVVTAPIGTSAAVADHLFGVRGGGTYGGTVGSQESTSGAASGFRLNHANSSLEFGPLDASGNMTALGVAVYDTGVVQAGGSLYALNNGAFGLTGGGGAYVLSWGVGGYIDWFDATGSKRYWRMNGAEAMNLDNTGNLATIGRISAVGLTSTASVIVGNDTATTPLLTINGDKTANRMLQFSTAGVPRWKIFAGTGETGTGNAGSDFTINAYTDAGGSIGTALTISRPTRSVIVGTSLAVGAGIAAFGATPPVSKPVVSGAKGSNAALGSLLTALAAAGFITDSTTA